MAGKKILFVIAPVDFRDEELAVPKEILEKAGHQVIVASTDRKLCRGALGAQVMPAMTVRDAKPFFYNGVVIVGGPGAPGLASHPEVIELIRQFFIEKKIVGAICVAPTILAKAGVLRGRKATVWSSVMDRKNIDILKENGATYLPTDVVRDGILITANGPEAAEKFGRKLVEALV
jgi:protease I